MEPCDVDPTYGLGIVARQTGHFAWAIELQNRALAMRPDFPGALVNRGMARVAMGRFGQAVSAAAPLLTHLADPERVLRIGQASCANSAWPPLIACCAASMTSRLPG
jgi:hypothetical protein